MKNQIISYSLNRGFSVKPLPDMDSPNTVVLVFGSPEFETHTSLWEELRRAYPRSHILGCSTSGEIFGPSIMDHSLVISVTKLERGMFRVAYAEIESAGQSYQAGMELARQLADPELRGVFVLSDGLKVNGSEFAKGMNRILPPGVGVSGGLAGDGYRFEKTWILKEGRPVSGCIASLGFYGSALTIGHGSQGGWDIFGPERLVTRSQGNVLFELDGKPALDLYKEYLGHRAADLPSSALLFPLSILSDGEEAKSLVRTILAIDETEKSLTFAGDIPQGAQVQLMRANFERLIEGAAESAALTSKDWTGVSKSPDAGPMLAIAISCVGRRLVLGQRAEEETEATLSVLPEGTQQIGFYSYGELSPAATKASCELHNQTMTFTTLSETVI